MSPEEMRMKVKDVEARCAVIHERARELGIVLDDVTIREERSVSVCSHADHEPSTRSRWRASMRPCGARGKLIGVKIEGACPSAQTLDGVTQQAIDDLRRIADSCLEEEPTDFGANEDGPAS